MPVKIRLARRGRKKRPFYHIVVADSRSPRDGRFIEKLGTYDPLTKPATIDLDRDRAYEWLMQGAQPTDTARAILRFKGILYRKHLMRGVLKGALTEEEALAKYEAWIADKEARIKKRRDAALAEKKEFQAAVSGVIPPIKIKEEPVEVEATETSAPEQNGAETAESSQSSEDTAESAATDDQASATEAPATEEVAEAPAESTSEKEEAKEEAPSTEAPASEESKEEAPEAGQEAAASEDATEVQDADTSENSSEAPSEASAAEEATATEEAETAGAAAESTSAEGEETAGTEEE